MNEIDFDLELEKIQFCMDMEIDVEAFETVINAVAEIARAFAEEMKETIDELNRVLGESVMPYVTEFAKSYDVIRLDENPRRYIPPKRPPLYVAHNQVSRRQLRQGRWK